MAIEIWEIERTERQRGWEKGVAGCREIGRVGERWQLIESRRREVAENKEAGETDREQ